MTLRGRYLPLPGETTADVKRQRKWVLLPGAKAEVYVPGEEWPTKGAVVLAESGSDAMRLFAEGCGVVAPNSSGGIGTLSDSDLKRLRVMPQVIVATQNDPERTAVVPEKCRPNSAVTFTDDAAMALGENVYVLQTPQP